jgi:tetratricopeptide (TPR) repeat protein
VNIAHCLLSLEKFEEAQKYYFKVLYFDNENIPVMRPIAWCSFMLGKYDSAEKYYLKILERKPTGYDFMNYAHLLFCLNKKHESSAFYIKSAQIIGLSKFNETLQYDSKFLVEKGILKNEILLLQDFVMTKL